MQNINIKTNELYKQKKGQWEAKALLHRLGDFLSNLCSNAVVSLSCRRLACTGSVT